MARWVICGTGVAWPDDSGIRGNYFPLRHPDSQNSDRENVTRWLTDDTPPVEIHHQKGLHRIGAGGVTISALRCRRLIKSTRSGR